MPALALWFLSSFFTFSLYPFPPDSSPPILSVFMTSIFGSHTFIVNSQCFRIYHFNDLPTFLFIVIFYFLLFKKISILFFFLVFVCSDIFMAIPEIFRISDLYGPPTFNFLLFSLFFRCISIWYNVAGASMMSLLSNICCFLQYLIIKAYITVVWLWTLDIEYLNNRKVTWPSWHIQIEANESKNYQKPKHTFLIPFVGLQLSFLHHWLYVYDV